MPTIEWNNPSSDDVNKTTTDVQLWADFATGNDSNNGLTSGTAKKTLAALTPLIKDLGRIANNISINLRGTFSNPGSVFWYFELIDGGNVRVDGGPDVTIVNNNSGLNYTITGSSGNTVTASAAAFTVDANRYYWIEFLTGPAAGEIQLIQRNTSTLITSNQPWNITPSSGTFRIVKPATTISGTSGFNFISIRTDRMASDGWNYIQRLNFSGTALGINVESPNSAMGIAACLFDNRLAATGNAITVQSVGSGSGLFFDGLMFDDSFVFVFAPGTAQRDSSGKVELVANTNLSIFYLLAERLRLRRCDGANFGACSFKKCEVIDSVNVFFQGFSGYGPMEVKGSLDSGLHIVNSNVELSSGGFDASSNTSHGVLVNTGVLTISTVLTGTSNGGAGLRGHTLSSVKFATGSTPTVTGTVGNASIDGVSATLWSTIAGGTPLSDTTEQTVIRKAA